MSEKKLEVKPKGPAKPEARDEEEEMLKRTEEFFEGERPKGLEALAGELKGKKVLLFGPARVGKTTLVLHLCKHLGRILYLDSDRNFPVPIPEYAKKIGVTKLTYEHVKSFKHALYLLKRTTADVVVVDSLSGLVAQLISEYGAGNPRATLLRVQYSEDLAKTCRDLFETAFVVTHSSSDFRRNVEVPRVTQPVLRYFDVIVKLSVDEEGRRTVTVDKREPIEAPLFTIAYGRVL